ncbi:SDR family NAD(P)-dependent oxidoreductase [Halomonas sp. Y3]|uniref:SDR family NAD(P)-dependent oxidoreductase n=1 Tax=Halomonas sp. Y3 TaxID=2956797 RepID=UPI0020A15EDB|nr:SDR family NAD(P)-dependent oxidoreductase [Halomonas sp. Y3]
MSSYRLLEGKVAVISGVTSGIGKACAELLIEKGCRVIGIGRRADRLDKLKEAWGAESFSGIECDLEDSESIRRFLDQIPSGFRPVNVLLNNAGLIQGDGQLTSLDLKQIETMININVRGLVLLTQAMVDELEKDGQIVNITSIGAHYHYSNGHVYAASKAFVDHFGRCMQAELIDSQIRVTNIAPGKTLTEFSLVQFNGDHEKAEAQYKNMCPLSPDDVANAVLWTLSQPTHVNVNRIELMPSGQNLSFR